VQVGPIGNCVSDVDADTKVDRSIRRLVSIMNGDLLLHLHGTAHRAVNAIEHDEQRITSSLDDAATMLVNRGIDHFPP
jgi:hypothetical protein